VQCLLLLAVVHASLGLASPAQQVLLVLWLCSLCGTGLGLCVSASFPTTEGAIAFLPLAILPMIVLGGGMMTLNEMRGSPLRKIADWAVPTRWAFEANLVSESDARRKDKFERRYTPEGFKKQAEEQADGLKNNLTECKTDLVGAQQALARARAGARIPPQTPTTALPGGSLPKDARQFSGGEAASFTDKPVVKPLPSPKNGKNEKNEKKSRDQKAQSDCDDLEGSDDVAQLYFTQCANSETNAENETGSGSARSTYQRSATILAVFALSFSVVALCLLLREEWGWWNALVRQIGIFG